MFLVASYLGSVRHEGNDLLRSDVVLDDALNGLHRAMRTFSNEEGRRSWLAPDVTETVTGN